MYECLSQVTLLGVRGVWQFCPPFLSPLHPFDGVVPFGKNSATPHPHRPPVLTLARPRPPARGTTKR